MKVSRTNFLEVLEKRWVARWRGLGAKLKADFGATCEIWSHSVGAATPFDGYTLGVEIRGSRPDDAYEVSLVVEFAQVRRRPRLVRASLDSRSPQGRMSRSLRPTRRLDSKLWEKLNRTLRLWSELLEPLFLFHPADKMTGHSVFIQAVSSKDESFVTEDARGTEPDFPFWRRYLKARPGPFVLGPGAGGLGVLPHAELQSYLLTTEPRLNSDTIEAAFGVTTFLRFAREDLFALSRPLPLLDLPEEGAESNRDWHREFYAKYPESSGFLSISRVGSARGQSLFFAFEMTMDQRGPAHLVSAVFQLENETELRSIEIPFEELMMQAHRQKHERAANGADTEQRVSTFARLVAENRFPDLVAAHYQRPDPSREFLPVLEVEHQDGTNQVFSLSDDFSRPLPRHRIEGLLLLGSRRDEEPILKACVDHWRGLPIPPLSPVFAPPTRRDLTLGAPASQLSTRYSMTRHKRMLRPFYEKLVPRLETAAQRFRQCYPGQTFRVWAHEAGRRNGLQAFTTGIAGDRVCLVVDVLSLHLFPRVHARLVDARGASLAPPIENQRRLSRTALTALLKRFEELNALGRRDAREPENPDRSEPPRLDWSTVDPKIRARVDKDSSRHSINRVSDLEKEVLTTLLVDFQIRHRLPKSLIVLDTSSSPIKGFDWLSAAAIHLSDELPGVSEELLDGVYGDHPEIELPPLPDHSLLASSWWPTTFLNHLYEDHLDAPGVVRVSRLATDSDQKRALLEVSLHHDIETHRERKPGYSFQAIGGDQAPPSGPPKDLVLAERGLDGWRVVGVRDMREVDPVGLEEAVVHAQASRILSNRELLDALGLDSILLEKTTHHRQEGTVFDLLVKTKSKRAREFSLGLHLFHRGDVPRIMPRPIAILRRLDEDDVRDALASLLGLYGSGSF